MGVVFDEEPRLTTKTHTARDSGFVSLVIRWGFAKNEAQASLLLISSVVLLCIASIFILFVSRPAPKGPTPEELQILQQQERRL